MEAAWLAAVALVPCLYNPYTGFSFGPEKAALLHGLGVLIAGAWLGQLVLERGAGRFESGLTWARSLWREPLGWSLAALLLSYLLSTCLSIDPAQSLWGDVQTRAGAYTFADYLLLFAAIAANLRSSEQVERFTSAVLVGSFAVSVYAIIQELHLDPLNWGANEMITSLVGHPVYVAAYLGMAFPLCLWRILGLLPGLPSKRGNPPVSARPSASATSVSKLMAGTLVFYCLLGALQLAAIILTGKRGPLFGLLSGVVCSFLLVSVRLSLRRLLLGTLVSAGAALGLLVLLNIPGGPLESLRAWRVLARFSHGAFSSREGTGYFRADLWKECPALMLSRQPVRRPDGASDRVHFLRAWFGYGAESTAGVLAQRYTVPHSGATLEDRFHNLVWDLWESTGAVGVAAFVALFAALYSYGLGQLGLIGGRRDTLRFLAWSLGFAVAGAIALSLWQGDGFCGLGLQLGLAAGCAAYPLKALRTAVQTQKPETVSPPLSDFEFQISRWAMLVIALISALVMHLVETGFAFPTAATATLFWSFAGLLVALRHQTAAMASQLGSELPTQVPFSAAAAVGSPSASTAKSKGRTPKHQKSGQRVEDRAATPGQRVRSNPFGAALWPAALTTMILVPLINMFLLQYTHQGLSSLDFITHALDPGRPVNAGRNVVPELLLGVWLGSAFLFTAPPSVSAPASGWSGRYFGALLFSGGGGAVYALWNAAQLARIGPLPKGSAEAWNLLNQTRGYETLYWVSMAVILVLILLCAYACSGVASSRLGRPAAAGLLAGFGALAAVGAIVIDLRPASAGIALRWAGVLGPQNAWPASREVFERAIELQPRQFIYRSRFSEALREHAAVARDDAGWSLLFKQAEDVLQTAKGVSGYNRGAWHLGQLYVIWAQRETNSDRRLQLVRQAKASFEEALSWEPKNPPLWSDYGFVDFDLLHNEQEGLRENQKALEIDPSCEQALSGLADFYAQKSREARDVETRRFYALIAVEFYAQAAGNSPIPFPYLMARGTVLMSLQAWSSALDQFSAACNIANKEQASLAQAMRDRASAAAGKRATKDSGNEDEPSIALPVASGQIRAAGALINAADDSVTEYLKGSANDPLEFYLHVLYGKSGSNPQGTVRILDRSYHKVDGALDTMLHTYIIKSSAIVVLSVTPGDSATPSKARLGCKANVLEILSNGTEANVEGNAIMTFTLTDYTLTSNNTRPNTVSINIQRNNVGVPYSKDGDSGINAEKPIASGVISIR
jgi:tetratricopeptide (TPR) repeat protein